MHDPMPRRPSRSKATVAAFVLIALALGGILGWGVGVFSRPAPHAAAPVVPPIASLVVQNNLPENAAGEIELRSDLSIFDLRFWRPVPVNLAYSQPVSPVNYANYLRVVKRKKVDRLFAHYATSGLRIDIQCVTHAFAAMRHDVPDLHGGQAEKEYAVAVDISKEPVGKVFLVLIEATYWNGFRSAEHGDVSTYTDTTPPVPDDLSVLVLFPETKPLGQLELDTSPSDNAAWTRYASQDEAYRDPHGLFAYWSIRRRQLAEHYRISWTW